jgi:hypothetical protein
VHNFRPYRHQPVDLEMCGRLAGDLSHDGAKTLSYNIAQFLQLFQPVYLFVTEHLVHAPPSTARVSTYTVFPADLRNPHRHSRNIPKPPHPLHLHDTVPQCVTSHPHPNFCTAHLHKGARMVVAHDVPQLRSLKPLRRIHCG